MCAARSPGRGLSNKPFRLWLGGSQTWEGFCNVWLEDNNVFIFATARCRHKGAKPQWHCLKLPLPWRERAGERGA
jgi:hypothetical protein